MIFEGFESADSVSLIQVFEKKMKDDLSSSSF